MRIPSESSRLWLSVLVFIIRFIHISIGSGIQTFTWLKKGFEENSIQRFYKSFHSSTRVHCVVTCRNVYDTDRVYFKDHLCHCLALPSVQESVLEGQVQLSSLDFIYQVHFGSEQCLSLNYTVFPGTNYCLKLVTESQPWYEAEKTCFKHGGHLVSPTTSEKFNHVLQIRGNLEHVYLGGVLPPASPNLNHFTWLSGEHVNDSLWSANEPSTQHGYEGAVELYSTGVLNDKQSSFPLPFVCEILIR